MFRLFCIKSCYQNFRDQITSVLYNSRINISYIYQNGIRYVCRAGHHNHLLRHLCRIRSRLHPERWTLPS
ncbi:unnamed protein product [Acanthoscelides obtectus]|uniref:Uncharacterized protein n=1 Tax=Acanthoscelides obtectus TaxID=200917 RepID=A0A9P0PW36_ACAOB|nr:unnamed protein product [Acanthoscelides obtectus]CAK1670416.1 hypothetical protein AOBTE_LOCUS27621 [Acanthoscelides obtectus]